MLYISCFGTSLFFLFVCLIFPFLKKTVIKNIIIKQSNHIELIVKLIVLWNHVLIVACFSWLRRQSCKTAERKNNIYSRQYVAAWSSSRNKPRCIIVKQANTHFHPWHADIPTNLNYHPGWRQGSPGWSKGISMLGLYIKLPLHPSFLSLPNFPDIMH